MPGLRSRCTTPAACAAREAVADLRRGCGAPRRRAARRRARGTPPASCPRRTPSTSRSMRSVLDEIVDADDVGVRDLARRRDLAAEALGGGRGIAGHASTRSTLSATRSPSLLVARQVDRAHAAVAQLALDGVAVGDLLPGASGRAVGGRSTGDAGVRAPSAVPAAPRASAGAAATAPIADCCAASRLSRALSSRSTEQTIVSRFCTRASSCLRSSRSCSSSFGSSVLPWPAQLR